MAEEKEVAEQEKPKKKSKFKLILIILIVLILAGGGAAAYFLIFAKKPAETAEGAAGKPAEKKTKADTATIGPLYSFDSFIVNLADPGGTRYLKVSMQAELDTDKLADEIEKRQPQIRDIILTVLSSKTYAEVSTAQGKLALKQEIMRRINLALTTGTIKSIYFTEFVSQ